MHTLKRETERTEGESGREGVREEEEEGEGGRQREG